MSYRFMRGIAMMIKSFTVVQERVIQGNQMIPWGRLRVEETSSNSADDFAEF